MNLRRVLASRKEWNRKMMADIKSNKQTLVFLIVTASAFIAAIAHSEENQDKGATATLRYTFSWAFKDDSILKPRGGLTIGPDVELAGKPSQSFQRLQDKSLTKKARDRLAILAMAGDYRTSFDFIETMGFSSDYEPPAPYQSWGTERVYVIADSEDFISLQHILVMEFVAEDGSVSEPMVVKHWRQDWQYEDDSIHEYRGHNTFERRAYESSRVNGSWSQTVYQVDDSPRYEAFGVWRHNSGLSEWESSAKRRPLPRREFSVRDDYQALFGRHRITISEFGWVQEEDSLKLVLDSANEPATDLPYLAREVGISRYDLIKNHDFTAGDKYWEKTEAFWQDVRSYWTNLYATTESFTVNKRADNQLMFVTLFQMADQSYPDADSRQQAIKAAITRFVVKDDGK